MERMTEKEMIRTMKKIEANTGNIAKEMGSIANVLRARGGMDAKPEPELLVADTEVTPEQARKAIETIKEYCEQIPFTHCSSSVCRISEWCDRRKEMPSNWVGTDA